MSTVALKNSHNSLTSSSANVCHVISTDDALKGDATRDEDFKRAAAEDSVFSLLPNKKILRLNDVQEGAPLFIFPGIEGNGMSFKELACRLPCPVYSLQFTRESIQPLHTVPEFADECIQMIYDVHSPSDEPISLLGYSFGSVVAHEVSVKLQEMRSIPVKCVAYVDGSPHLIKTMSDYFYAKNSKDDPLLYWYFLMWNGISCDSQKFRYQMLLRQDMDSQYALVTEYLAAKMGGAINKDEVAACMTIFRKKIEAACNYNPSAKRRRYKGNVLLFKAEKAVTSTMEMKNDYGFSTIIDGAVQVYEAPGDHSTVMTGEGCKKISRILLPKLL